MTSIIIHVAMNESSSLQTWLDKNDTFHILQWLVTKYICIHWIYSDSLGSFKVKVLYMIWILHLKQYHIRSLLPTHTIEYCLCSFYCSVLCPYEQNMYFYRQTSNHLSWEVPLLDTGYLFSEKNCQHFYRKSHLFESLDLLDLGRCGKSLWVETENK